MVSFRNTQFQAILTGIVIADAVSHGRLCQQVSTGFGYCHKAVSSTTRLDGGIASDRWCHHTVNQLKSSSTLALTAISPQREARPSLPLSKNPIESALFKLPSFLEQLDQAPIVLPNTDATCPESLLYSAMAALLDQDIQMTQQIYRGLIARSTSEAFSRALAIALDSVFQANGDFSLSVGQSLHVDLPMPGLPILTALLSTSWTGSLSLPLPAQWALDAPPPLLQAWLTERWSLSTTRQLETWAATLWRKWAGDLTALSSPSANVAILPASP